MSDPNDAEIKAAFLQYDKNGDGHIELKELGKFLKSMGLNVKKKELKKRETDYKAQKTDDVRPVFTLRLFSPEYSSHPIFSSLFCLDSGLRSALFGKSTWCDRRGCCRASCRSPEV